MPDFFLYEISPRLVTGVKELVVPSGDEPEMFVSRYALFCNSQGSLCSLARSLTHRCVILRRDLDSDVNEFQEVNTVKRSLFFHRETIFDAAARPIFRCWD